MWDMGYESLLRSSTENFSYMSRSWIAMYRGIAHTMLFYFLAQLQSSSSQTRSIRTLHYLDAVIFSSYARSLITHLSPALLSFHTCRSRVAPQMIALALSESIDLTVFLNFTVRVSSPPGDSRVSPVASGRRRALVERGHKHQRRQRPQRHGGNPTAQVGGSVVQMI